MHCGGEIGFPDAMDFEKETVGVIGITEKGIERGEKLFQPFGVFAEDDIGWHKDKLILNKETVLHPKTNLE